MERYDLIVHDISAIWGIFLGKILNRPYVCCFPARRSSPAASCFEGGEYVKESNHILERLLTRFQITGLTVTNLFTGGPGRISSSAARRWSPPRDGRVPARAAPAVAAQGGKERRRRRHVREERRRRGASSPCWRNPRFRSPSRHRLHLHGHALPDEPSLLPDVLRRVQEQPAPVCHVCGQGQPWYV
ncbi:uncharacterized protein ACA1_009060, partial [Acanthamoeba castellanii str. Neff]